MIRVSILGYSGRMGQAIAGEIALRKDCAIVAGLVRQAGNSADRIVTAAAEQAIRNCDIAIDFSSATMTAEFAQLAAKLNKPLLVGTTGIDAAAMQALQVASRNIPVLYAPNTSLSLAAMKQVTALAAKLLASFDYDIAILDRHHRDKQDAPSGTAKALGEVVLNGNKGARQPSYAAIRAGSIVGEHEVSFNGAGETIILKHSVTDRRIFAQGAITAALWLHGKPAGFYSMDDVLGLART